MRHRPREGPREPLGCACGLCTSGLALPSCPVTPLGRLWGAPCQLPHTHETFFASSRYSLYIVYKRIPLRCQKLESEPVAAGGHRWGLSASILLRRWVGGAICPPDLITAQAHMQLHPHPWGWGLHPKACWVSPPSNPTLPSASFLCPPLGIADARPSRVLGAEPRGPADATLAPHTRVPRACPAPQLTAQSSQRPTHPCRNGLVPLPLISPLLPGGADAERPAPPTHRVPACPCHYLLQVLRDFHTRPANRPAGRRLSSPAPGAGPHLPSGSALEAPEAPADDLWGQHGRRPHTQGADAARKDKDEEVPRQLAPRAGRGVWRATLGVLCLRGNDRAVDSRWHVCL